MWSTLDNEYASSQWSKCCGLTRYSTADKSTEQAKPHLLIYPNINDNKRNLGQDFLTIENTDLKEHALHYANELPVSVRLSFQKLLQISTRYDTKYEKNVWEKSDDAYSLSIRVQTTLNHI